MVDRVSSDLQSENIAIHTGMSYKTVRIEICPRGSKYELEHDVLLLARSKELFISYLAMVVLKRSDSWL